MNFPLLDTLRSATADLHREVEAKMNLLDPAMSEAEYFTKLGRLRAWSEALLRAGPAKPDWDPELGTRLAWLARDLGDRAPASPLTMAAFDADAWWGACYVIEGSSLGGQVLCRQLGPRWPTRYFEGRGAETGRRWMAFLEALRTAAPTLDGQKVAAGATLAFEALG